MQLNQGFMPRYCSVTVLPNGNELASTQVQLLRKIESSILSLTNEILMEKDASCDCRKPRWLIPVLVTCAIGVRGSAEWRSP